MTTFLPLSRLPKLSEQTPYDAVSPSAARSAHLDTNKTISEQNRAKPTPSREGRKPRKSRAKTAPQFILEREHTKLTIVQLLEATGGVEAQNVHERMARCSDRLWVRPCMGGHVNSYRPAYSCNHRLCTWCAHKRANRLKGKYAPALIAFGKARPDLTPTLLTLTLAHRVGESVLEAKKRLYKAFKKASRRALWREYISGGGLASYEFTLAKDGCWHMHMHALVFVKGKLNKTHWAQFRELWSEVTGDSHVVNFKPVTNLSDGVREVVKYIAKPSDAYQWSVEHMSQLLALRKQRMIVTFGEFAEFAKKYEPDTEAEPVAPDGEFMAEAGHVCNRDGCDLPVVDMFLTPIQTARLYMQEAQARGKPDALSRWN